MRIVGYAYDADVHCPSCTDEYARKVAEELNLFPDFYPDDADIEEAMNEDRIKDSEGNCLHPIFDTDESGDCPEHCDDCGEFIDTSWSGECANYALEALNEYIESGQGSGDVLDIWAANLRWCSLSDEDVDTIATYELLRERETSGKA